MNTNRAQEPALESWKEIAAYLQRDTTTAQRWEKEEGLPVHRHSHKSRSSVYAYPSEIDAWRASRKVVPEPAPARPLWKIPAFALTIALCLVMVGNGFRPQTALAQGAQASQRLVWTEASLDYGDISGDGRYLPFADAASGELLVRDLTTGTNRRISFLKKNGWIGDYGNARGAHISPDNTKVAFTWYAPLGHWALKIAPMSGDPGKLKNFTAEGEAYMQAWAWTSDSQSLVVVRELPDKTSQVGMFSVSTGAFRVLKSLEWRYPTRVSLSPDERYLAYDVQAGVNRTSTRDIFVLAVDGSRETLAVSGAADDYAPIWSPDGSQIVFISDRTPNDSLWAVPIQNGKPSGPEQLVKADMAGTVLGMTRDGALYYVPRVSRRNNAHVVELDPEAKAVQPAVLAVDKTVNSNTYPTWSPDGQSLAYFVVTGPGKNQRNQYVLMIRSVKTGEDRMVPLPSKLWLVDGGVEWFPDGRSVMVVARNDDNRMAYYRVELTTGKADLVLAAQSNVYVLSRDGKTVYYGGSDTESRLPSLFRYEIAAGRETKLKSTASNRVFFSSITESPDGAQIAYLLVDSPNQSKTVEIMPSTGGKSREVFRAAPWLEGNSLTWTPDQRYLLVARGLEKEQDPESGIHVLRVSVNGGEAERTGIVMKGTPILLGLTNLSVHPNGRRVVYGSSDESIKETWVLENFLPKVAGAKQGSGN